MLEVVPKLNDLYSKINHWEQTKEVPFVLSLEAEKAVQMMLRFNSLMPRISRLKNWIKSDKVAQFFAIQDGSNPLLSNTIRKVCLPSECRSGEQTRDRSRGTWTPVQRKLVEDDHLRKTFVQKYLSVFEAYVKQRAQATLAGESNM